MSFFHSKRSVPTFCQGSSGNWDGVSGCALCLWALQHSGQFRTSSSKSLENPGHQTLCLALSLHFVMPWCPMWIFVSIAWRSEGGITMRLPRINRPFTTENSAAIGEYDRMLAVRDFLSGQPDWQKTAICWVASSSSWCRLISSSRCSVAGRFCRITLMKALASCCRSSSAVVGSAAGARESVSAIIRSLPGTCHA